MQKIGFLDSIVSDLRFSVRSLWRRPSFSFAVVLTLALGIGATTAIFSVVYSVLIKPLPYPNADELVRIRHSIGGHLGTADFEPTLYLTYRDESRTMAAFGIWQESGATLTEGGEPQRVRALRITDGILQTLGTQPANGRGFTEAEYGTGFEGPAPVILSHAFWQRRFGGDDSVIGRPIQIDAHPAQVVGIMPPDFRFLDMSPQPDMVLTAQLAPFGQLMTTGAWGFSGLARLKPGVTPEEARADVERMLPIWREAWTLPPPETGLTRETLAGFDMAAVVRPLKDDLVGDVASMLWVLMGSIGAVLLVACANVANLMLVRSEARQQELALRAALGAHPARVARASVAESLVVGAFGCALSLLLAYLGLEVLVAIGPSNLPRLQEVAIHPPVLAVTVAAALASTFLFGSITALKHARSGGRRNLLAGRGSSGSRERSVTRNTLVVVQVAFALALVASAALMARTFLTLRGIDPGFRNPEFIQTGRIWMPNSAPRDAEQSTRVQHEILDKIAALPGVDAVGLTSLLPMEGEHTIAPVFIEGQLPAGGTPPGRMNKFVSPGYFQAMGTRFIAGRDITWSDIEAGGRVVVISEELARELAPEPAGAIGKRVRTFFETDAWREVIGVVQSVRENGLYEDASSFIYWPVLAEDIWGASVLGTPSAALAIRSERAGTASLAQEVRQAIRSINSSVASTSERTMLDVYAGSLARTSFTLVMLGIAGGMALLLGVIGIYGVIAYVVSQRVREIGIRSALGAEPRRLERMFVAHGLKLCAAGAVIGLLVAAVLGRLMSSLLFGVAPTDPVAFAGAIFVTVAAATLASYLPARRAASVDPVDALRSE